jgi:Skp family chaperone for outer membrane proteins
MHRAAPARRAAARRIARGLVAACICLFVAFALGGPRPATAQDAPYAGPQAGVPLRSPVLVIDFERLFVQSRFGQRVLREIEEAGRALIEENDRIEAELSAEELLLTSQRDTLPPEEFRLLADAFDEKVQRLRREQQTKAESVGQGREAEQRRFRQLATPIIARLMQEAGAAVVLDRSDAVVWVEAIDITDDVLRLADRVIGAGERSPDRPDAAAPETPDGTASEAAPEAPTAPPEDAAPQMDTPTQMPAPPVPAPSETEPAEPAPQGDGTPATEP